MEFSNNITGKYSQAPDPEIKKKKIFIGGNRAEAMSLYDNGGIMEIAEERHRSILQDLSESSFSKKTCGRSFRKCVECGYKTFPNSERTGCTKYTT